MSPIKMKLQIYRKCKMSLLGLKLISVKGFYVKKPSELAKTFLTYSKYPDEHLFVTPDQQKNGISPLKVCNIFQAIQSVKNALFVSGNLISGHLILAVLITTFSKPKLAPSEQKTPPPKPNFSPQNSTLASTRISY